MRLAVVRINGINGGGAFDFGGQSNGGDFIVSGINGVGAFDFGGQSNGGDFIVSGTIGQHDANTASTGGDFALSGGFWISKNNNDIIFKNGFED